MGSGHHQSLILSNHCGGIGPPLAVLDSRKGRTFRLTRCFSCEKLDWHEEK